MKAIVVLVVLGAGLWSHAAPPSTRRNPEAAEHIRKVIAALPEGSALRSMLERGDKGDGVHYPWMDKMRKEGIRRALVQSTFVWRGKPTDVRFSRIVYFSKYDRNCSQVSEPQRLSRIRASGLAEELGEEAAKRTINGHWFIVDSRHPTEHGVSFVELLDDEWLPTPPAILAPSPKTPPSRFHEALEMNDVAEAASLLLQGNVTPRERDGELWTSLMDDDSCMTKALLGAGADVNLRSRDDGYTLLMVAVREKAFWNVKALVAAGADINAKARNGETALSIALREHNEQIAEFLRLAGAER